MKFRCLVVISCLALTLAAQSQQERERMRRARQQSPKPLPVEVTGDGVKSEDGLGAKQLTPAQREAARMRRGAASFCQFHLHTKPPKLMPGQSGTVIVTAVMKGEAVLPSPAPFQVTSPASQGAIQLGAPTFRPAGLGRLAEAYLGRPVYDNYAILEMPITMASTAKLGQEHRVSVEMKFELFDGSSGQSIGEFIDRAFGNVPVGKSFDPDVRGGYEPPVTAEATAAPVNVPVREPGSDDEPRPAAIGGASPVVNDDPPSVDDPMVEIAEPGPTPVFAEDESNFWLLLAGGGAVAAAVLLLLLKRR